MSQADLNVIAPFTSGSVEVKVVMGVYGNANHGAIAVTSGDAGAVEISVASGQLGGSNFGIELKMETTDAYLKFASSGDAVSPASGDILFARGDGWKYFPYGDTTRISLISTGAGVSGWCHYIEYPGA